MDFILGFLLLDIGIAIGIGLMCLITLRGGCYEGCLLRKAAGIEEYVAEQHTPLVWQSPPGQPLTAESLATPLHLPGDVDRRRPEP